MVKRMARESKTETKGKTSEKPKVVKTAAVAIPSRSSNGGTSSEAREQVWNLMLKTPGMTVSDMAERVGLKPSAISFAVKYFKQITYFLKERGKLR